MSTAHAPPARAPLWPQPVPIIGVTGPKWAGKSKFCLNICPEPHATLVFDLEQSTTSYEAEYARVGAPFDRVDVQKEMHKLHPTGYKPVDLWTWWLAQIRAVPAGKYRVIAVDPATDLERGLADWVSANPQAFGHTHQQYTKMSGVMWGDVKDYLKMILADVCARCETFVFTAHLGAEFQGGSATGKLKPKGKETLYELSSLYLWLERLPDAKGVRPNVPAAKVEKSRLEIASLVDGEVVSYSVLPSRIPECTPRKIREYFKSPAGGRALTDAERARDETMSADEKLRLETAKAEAEATAAQARLAMVQAGAMAPPPADETTPAECEAKYERQIAAAETLESLLAIPPRITLANNQGRLPDDAIARLKAVYGERKQHLTALIEATAPTT